MRSAWVPTSERRVGVERRAERVRPALARGTMRSRLAISQRPTARISHLNTGELAPLALNSVAIVPVQPANPAVAEGGVAALWLNASRHEGKPEARAATTECGR